MVILEKENQVYKVDENSALYTQLKNSGFEEANKKEKALTLPQIKKLLKEKEVQFDDKADKDELLALLEGAE